MSRLFFSFKLGEATSSIPVMKMLAEQAETNVPAPSVIQNYLVQSRKARNC